jgi:hypothetical protein
MCETRQTRRHSPSRVARTRQTRERRVWRVLREFSESGESGEFVECRLDRFIHIKYVICAKNDLSYHACLRRAVLRAIFEKNVTRLATFARVIRHSREFGASGHCLIKIQEFLFIIRKKISPFFITYRSGGILTSLIPS